MTIKEALKLFLSTSLLFFMGFSLVLLRAVFTQSTLISFRDNFIYFITQIVIMILAGVFLYCITKWKSLRLKKSFKYRKMSQEYILSLKWRGLFILIFAIIAIYFTRIQWGFTLPLISKIDNLFYPEKFYYIFLKFTWIISNPFTYLFIFILILSYMFSEFLFSCLGLTKTSTSIN